MNRNERIALCIYFFEHNYLYNSQFGINYKIKMRQNNQYRNMCKLANIKIKHKYSINIVD